MGGRPGRSRPSLPPILSSAGGPAGKRRRPTKTRTSAQVSAAVRLRDDGARRRDDRLCTVGVAIPIVEGADGQLTIVPPPRPPSRSEQPVDNGNQEKEKSHSESRIQEAAGANRATIGARLDDRMELSDFLIGGTFWTQHGAFRCTDVGTRVVVAVKLGPREIGRAQKVDGELRITKRIDDDASWLNGPPYAVEEVVFDENELLGCFRNEAELLGDAEDE